MEHFNNKVKMKQVTNLRAILGPNNLKSPHCSYLWKEIITIKNTEACSLWCFYPNLELETGCPGFAFFWMVDKNRTKNIFNKTFDFLKIPFSSLTSGFMFHPRSFCFVRGTRDDKRPGWCRDEQIECFIVSWPLIGLFGNKLGFLLVDGWCETTRFSLLYDLFAWVDLMDCCS